MKFSFLTNDLRYDELCYTRSNVLEARILRINKSIFIVLP
jgi:hypothetical protein